jgi:hypothetical protein
MRVHTKLMIVFGLLVVAAVGNVAAGDFLFAPVRAGVLENGNFAQKTFSEAFSAEGRFAGKTIDDVAGALRGGKMMPGEVPIDYIVRDGQTLILNTRSSQALMRAGVPRAQWNAVNREKRGHSAFSLLSCFRTAAIRREWGQAPFSERRKRSQSPFLPPIGEERFLWAASWAGGRVPLR